MFLGFVNFYKRYICSYSKITGLLIDLMKKKIKKLKTVFSNDMITRNKRSIRCAKRSSNFFLKYFNPKFSVRLKINVSDYALAGILF